MPGALRSFLDRVERMGSAPGIGGVAHPSPAREPDVVPDGGQFVTGLYSNRTGSRTYKLYVPSGYCGQALPLVVMLHGCTQSPDDFAAGTRMNALAEEHTCLVAYPAQAASANASKCWNWFNPGHQQRGQGEPSLIAGITRQVIRDYSVDSRRVYVAGLSAGAAAAVIMGITYPDLYAAIGAHSGLAGGAASDLRSAFAVMRQGAAMRRSGSAPGDGEYRWIVPTIVFHGDEDTTVHPRNGDQIIAQSRANMTVDLQTRVQHGRVPGGHVHPGQQESFEVREGVMRFRKGLRTVTASPGDLVVVEPGTYHRFANAGDEPAIVRVRVTPALRMEDLFETVAALAAEGRTLPSGMPRPLDLALFMREFEQEVTAPVAPALARTVMAPLAAIGERRGLAARYRRSRPLPAGPPSVRP